jgi:hypothetical protein
VVTDPSSQQRRVRRRARGQSGVLSGDGSGDGRCAGRCAGRLAVLNSRLSGRHGGFQGVGYLELSGFRSTEVELEGSDLKFMITAMYSVNHAVCALSRVLAGPRGSCQVLAVVEDCRRLPRVLGALVKART